MWIIKNDTVRKSLFAILILFKIYNHGFAFGQA